MKKITQLLAVSFLAVSGAQAQFFEETDFVGALSSDPSKDWTTGWTNFNPQQTNYAAANETSTLDASSTGKKDITNTVTLDASKVYLLKGLIIIRDGGKLVIPAGTLIRCEADVTATPKNYASIIVERGGQIEINGTSTNPVIFTSNKAAGSRSRGDWGGIVLNGKATNNQGSDVQVEGFNNISFESTLAKGGGTSNDDNSGILKYVRLEFGGLAFEANKEINGVTFNSVGSKTTVEGVQVSFCNDDGFEWFGGTVNCKKLIAYRITDDDFDTDYGYRGAVQFGIGVKDTTQYDLTYNAPSGSSTSEGFESDNDAGGSGKTPYTQAVFSNMTMVGPIEIGKTWSDLPAVQQAAFRRGARIRRNSRTTIVNSVFMGYRNFLFFDGDSTMKAAGVMDSTFVNTMGFRNNLIVNSAAGAPASSSANGLIERTGSVSLTRFDGWIKASQNANNINPVAYTSKTVLEDPQNPTTPNFRPVSASPAISGADFTYQRLKDFGTYNSINSIAALGAWIVFPNPAQDILNTELDLNAPVTASIRLTDLNGRIVADAGTRNLAAGNNRISMSLSDVQQGMYLLVVETADGKLTSRVMVHP